MRLSHQVSSLAGLAAVVAATLLIQGAPSAEAGAYKVYSTYLWHLQQPIYWPEKVQGQNRYQFAHDSLGGSPGYPGHPLNNLADIFGKDDRKAVYQYRTRDAVSSMGQADAGAQLSYSGCLIENIRSLGENNSTGYSPSWNAAIQEGMGWTTSRGKRKLEPVGFTYHHAIAPLIDKDALRKELAINKEIWWKAWNGNPDKSDHPKGFRCAEESFSLRILKELVEAGYEWVVVPNHHLSRTHPNYVPLHGNGRYDPPNKADQINPPNHTGAWYSGDDTGRGSTESIPFSFQAHRAKYVDPETGTEYKMMVVPMTDLGSWKDGFNPQGLDLLHNLNSFASHDQPCLALFCHDGDNAWGGGFSYYVEAVPNYVGAAAGAGYRPTTIQTFLDENPPPDNDIVHVEDGSWFNAESDWGHPLFINWLWPPQRDNTAPEYVWNDPSTFADVENGWTEDFRNWAVIVAAQNFVSTAEQVHKDNGGTVDDWKIQEPVQPNGTDNGANDAELAWHFFLPSLTSGYMYYGKAIDMEVKQALACNQAIPYAQNILNAHPASDDNTGPTVFVPQRYPYNPGSLNYGPNTRYIEWVAPSDFDVWTFAYDVSGVTSVVLKVRVDADGFNPLDHNDNETYAGGPAVGSWDEYTMNFRSGATFRDNIFNDPEIDFFITPTAIADEYWYRVTGYNNVLLDYYVEAYDTHGHVEKTDIQHVFVGTEGGSTPVIFSPAAPEDCDDLVTTYNPSGRPLDGVNPVHLTITLNNWTTSDSYIMSQLPNGNWVYTNDLPDATTSAEVYFHNGGGTIDNNDGNNWAVSVSECSATLPSTVDFDPPSPGGCGDVVVRYWPHDGPLKDAAGIFAHIGHDDFQDLVTPSPGLTQEVSGAWSYVYSVPRGATEINVTLNDGDNLWDNNFGNDWSVTVTGCDDPVTFTPGEPEDCDDLVIAYDPAGGPLDGVSPVKVQLDWQPSVSPPVAPDMAFDGSIWTYTNPVPVDQTNLVAYFHNGAGTVDDNGGANWEVPIAACSLPPNPSFVEFSPVVPSGCGDVTISYYPEVGPLKDASPVFIHIGRNNWQDVLTNGTQMTDGGSNRTFVYSPPPGTIEINCVFHNGAGIWDNNADSDWAVEVENCSGGVTQGITFAYGSPAITSNPETQNNVGDAFDLNPSGGDAVTTDQGGFGSFGHLYVNHDETHFTIGGVGCNVGADNNVMMIFLAFDTLAHDKGVLWDMNGAPNALDVLHNVAFSPAMDLAIVLGDEYGDGTYASFGLGSGADMGQGVFSLAGGSFSEVVGAEVSQFDGAGTSPTTSDDDDGDRLMDRWEARIPWSSLGATSLGSITSCHVAGLMANDSISDNDRYLSGNYLGLSAASSSPLDGAGNFGFGFVTLTGLDVAFPNADEDDDGLPDDWEERYWGDATAGEPGDDDDDDGFTNIEEYQLGTHPKSAASKLVTSDVVLAGDTASVTWESVGGRTYSIQYSEDLSLPAGGFQELDQVLENDVAEDVGTTETFIHDLSAAPPPGGLRGYSYRVRLVTE